MLTDSGDCGFNLGNGQSRIAEPLLRNRQLEAPAKFIAPLQLDGISGWHNSAISRKLSRLTDLYHQQLGVDKIQSLLCF